MDLDRSSPGAGEGVRLLLLPGVWLGQIEGGVLLVSDAECRDSSLKYSRDLIDIAHQARLDLDRTIHFFFPLNIFFPLNSLHIPSFLAGSDCLKVTEDSVVARTELTSSLDDLTLEQDNIRRQVLAPDDQISLSSRLQAALARVKTKELGWVRGGHLNTGGRVEADNDVLQLLVLLHLGKQTVRDPGVDLTPGLAELFDDVES